MNIKEILYNTCLENVENRIKLCSETLQMVQESLNAETKSTAGDKHETGRAMIQLEREKTGDQLAKYEIERSILLRINLELKTDKIRLGSLVRTAEMNIFIAISIGKVSVQNEDFYVISPEAPLALAILNKSEGDTVIFRDRNLKIISVI